MRHYTPIICAFISSFSRQHLSQEGFLSFLMKMPIRELSSSAPTGAIPLLQKKKNLSLITLLFYKKKNKHDHLVLNCRVKLPSTLFLFQCEIASLCSINEARRHFASTSHVEWRPVPRVRTWPTCLANCVPSTDVTQTMFEPDNMSLGSKQKPRGPSMAIIKQSLQICGEPKSRGLELPYFVNQDKPITCINYLFSLKERTPNLPFCSRQDRYNSSFFVTNKDNNTLTSSLCHDLSLPFV